MSPGCPKDCFWMVKFLDGTRCTCAEVARLTKDRDEANQYSRDITKAADITISQQKREVARLQGVITDMEIQQRADETKADEEVARLETTNQQLAEAVAELNPEVARLDEIDMLKKQLAAAHADYCPYILTCEGVQPDEYEFHDAENCPCAEYGAPCWYYKHVYKPLRGD